MHTFISSGRSPQDSELKAEQATATAAALSNPEMSLKAASDSNAG
jgi:hypothetical protein